VFVEASRHLAKRMMTTDNSPESSIKRGYRLLTFKELPSAKLTILNNLYEEALSTYKTDTASFNALTKEASVTPQQAAMAVVASALLNLDEVLTRE
jgi:hypothetical protein